MAAGTEELVEAPEPGQAVVAASNHSVALAVGVGIDFAKRVRVGPVGRWVFVAEARDCTFRVKRVGVRVWVEVRKSGMAGREGLRLVRGCFRRSRSLRFPHLILWMVVPVGTSGEVEMDIADSRRAVVAEAKRRARMIVAGISCLVDVAVARYRRCRSPDLDKVVMAVEVGRCIVAA
jgi:hypothetical protein